MYGTTFVMLSLSSDLPATTLPFINPHPWPCGTVKYQNLVVNSRSSGDLLFYEYCKFGNTCFDTVFTYYIVGKYAIPDAAIESYDDMNCPS